MKIGFVKEDLKILFYPPKQKHPFVWVFLCQLLNKFMGKYISLAIAICNTLGYIDFILSRHFSSQNDKSFYLSNLAATILCFSVGFCWSITIYLFNK
jgi:hypothetical protein